MKEMEDLTIWWDQIEEDARQQAGKQLPPPSFLDSNNLSPAKVPKTLQQLMDSFRLESYRNPVASRFCCNGGRLIKILDVEPQQAKDAIHCRCQSVLISIAFTYRYIAIAPTGSETELSANQARKLSEVWHFDKPYAEILNSANI